MVRPRKTTSRLFMRKGDNTIVITSVPPEKVRASGIVLDAGGCDLQVEVPQIGQLLFTKVDTDLLSREQIIEQYEKEHKGLPQVKRKKQLLENIKKRRKEIEQSPDLQFELMDGDTIEDLYKTYVSPLGDPNDESNIEAKFLDISLMELEIKYIENLFASGEAPRQKPKGGNKEKASKENYTDIKDQ